MEKQADVTLERPTNKPKVRFPLLRFLFYSFWLRLALLVIGLLSAFVVGVLLPIWRTSPPGFKPQIKISGLELAKSWALARTGRKAAAEGRANEAIHAWGAASIHNPANPELSRGLLQALLLDTTKTNYVGAALQSCFWLLHLTQTNQADLELTVRVFEHYSLHPVILQLLQPMEARLTPALAAAYLKALFNSGQIEAFSKTWDQWSGRMPQNPQLPLYYAAYQAGWKPAAAAGDAWRQLEAAQADTALQSLANRLEMVASFHAQDVAHFEHAINKATAGKTVTLLDHLNFWRLLAATQQKPRALQLAQSYATPPASASETMLLAGVFMELGLRQPARSMLASYVNKFAGSQELWIFYANVLMNDRQWEALTAVASQIRQEKALHNALLGYSYYLEGRAEVAKDHLLEGQTDFERCTEYEFANPLLAVSVSKSLLALHFPQTAKRLLLKYQKQLSSSPDYWQALYETGAALKDENLLLSTANEMFRLAPNNWLARYYKAAALITLRTNSDEAVRLAAELPGQQPSSMGAKINCALALVLDGRVPEAETMLKGIDPQRLRSNETTAYYFALFQIELARRQYDQARQASSHVNRDYLFHTEQKWFEEALQQLPGAQAAPTGSSLSGKAG